MSRMLVGCRVLEDELGALVADRPQLRVELVEQGLHQEPDHLRERLQAIVDAADGDSDIDTVVLAYGRCGGGTIGLTPRRVRLVMPRAHDCLTMLLGCRRRYAKLAAERPAAYWYSVGWNRYGDPPRRERVERTRRLYAETYGDDNADFLMEQMESWATHCDEALFVDAGLGDSQAAQTDTRRFASEMGWRYRCEQGDPALITALLDGPWDDERFLVVQPGERVVSGDADGVLATEPCR